MGRYLHVESFLHVHDVIVHFQKKIVRMSSFYLYISTKHRSFESPTCDRFLLSPFLQQRCIRFLEKNTPILKEKLRCLRKNWNTIFIQGNIGIFSCCPLFNHVKSFRSSLYSNIVLGICLGKPTKASIPKRTAAPQDLVGKQGKMSLVGRSIFEKHH